MLNGVVAVPVMAMMVLLSARPDTMGDHAIGITLKVLGWLATSGMAAAVVGAISTA